MRLLFYIMQIVFASTLLSLFFFGCADKSSPDAVKSLVASPIAAPSATPSVEEPAIEVVPDASPSPTPEASPTPSPTPTPVATPILNCVSRMDGAFAGAFCDDSTWIDLRKTFSIDPSFYSIRVYRIDNDVIAQTNGTICPTANRACFAHSVCVYTFVHVSSTAAGETGYVKCGNKLNIDRTLGVE